MADRDMFNDFLTRVGAQMARDFENAPISGLRPLEELGGEEMESAIYVIYGQTGVPITAGMGSGDEGMNERLAALSAAGVVAGFRSVSFASADQARAVLRIVAGLFGGSMVLPAELPRRRRGRPSGSRTALPDDGTPRRGPGRPRKTPPPGDLPPTA